MTRKEFLGAISDLCEGGVYVERSEEAQKAELALLDHDAEQRAEIAWLKERDNVAKWYETLVTREKIGTAHTPSLRAYIEQLEAEIARLREALQTLVDVQNGPPLEKYRVEWEQVMNNAESLLKETL